jgi:cystathionine beta-lyase
VVVQTPVYRPFFRAVEIMNRRLVTNPLVREGLEYRMDLDGLAASLDGSVRLLLLCSPHNPVARVWTPEELRDLGNLCRERGVIVVSDDIHSDLVMPGHTYTPLAALGDDFAAGTVTCSSPSKTFNIPGAGCAFVVIPDAEKRAAFQRAGRRTSALDLPNIFSVTAAEAAYRGGGGWLDGLIPYLRDNYLFLKDFLGRELPDVRVFPQEGTYVVWLDFRGLGLGDREVESALTDARVRLNAGSAFGQGGEGFQRLNIACPRGTLREGLRRIAEAFSGGGK